MVNIVLFQPQIPANTGNIVRLCANTKSNLHLIQPYGFIWSSKKLKRAHLDYEKTANITHHLSFDDFIFYLNSNFPHQNLYLATTKSKDCYSKIKYTEDDFIMFGSETSGVTTEVSECEKITKAISIPMAKGNRSINLSNSVAIILYESKRQIGFF
jgi:tRNA (cytidine/uridine-2'-O-)-methyltransferase